MVPPVQETATGTVEENAAPKETVAAAEKPQEIPQETAKEQPPAVEQPKAVAPPAKKGASPASIIIFCAVLAVAVMLIILRVRKKPKMGVIYGGMPKDLKEPEQLIRQ